MDALAAKPFCMKKYTHLCDEERFVIEKLLGAALHIRYIAAVLSRSPNTVSREIFRNSVDGMSKQDCLKVALDAFLTRFVTEKLQKKWSPKQISGCLKLEYGITCSAKAIYKFAESRCLEQHLFWRWNKRKGGRKKNRSGLPHDGRVYIDERPSVDGAGHLEMDFIVSKVFGAPGGCGPAHQAQLACEASKQKAQHYSCCAFCTAERCCCSKYHHRQRHRFHVLERARGSSWHAYLFYPSLPLLGKGVGGEHQPVDTVLCAKAERYCFGD